MVDATFVKYPEDVRATILTSYLVFWWWRDTEGRAGRRQETDSDKPETRYRALMVTQFLREPLSDDQEGDRKTLKSGMEPLITEEHS